MTNNAGGGNSVHSRQFWDILGIFRKEIHQQKWRVRAPHARPDFLHLLTSAARARMIHTPPSLLPSDSDADILSLSNPWIFSSIHDYWWSESNLASSSSHFEPGLVDFQRGHHPQPRTRSKTHFPLFQRCNGSNLRESTLQRQREGSVDLYRWRRFHLRPQPVA